MLLATASQMQNLDAAAINGAGIPGLTLMENAGQATVTAMTSRYGALSGLAVAIFAGPGNNGGDGLVIARLLHNRGARPLVFLFTDPDRMTKDAAANLAEARKLPIPLTVISTDDAPAISPPACDLAVDALFGTGLKRGLTGRFAVAVDCINKMKAPVVAVDIPSGLDSDSGQPLGVCVRADLTVTYGLAKPGQFIEPGRSLTGKLMVADIGIPPELVAEAGLDLELIDQRWLKDILAPRQPDSHKGSHGHLLVLAGSAGKLGAAVLAVRGGLRGGAGLVTLAAPADCGQLLASSLAEAMTLPLPRSPGCFDDAAAASVLAALAGKTAVTVGPGIGTNEATARLVCRLYQECPLPMVVDADGLNILAATPEIISKAAGPRILTPHPGEMARLTGVSSKEIQKNRLATARDFALRHKVFMVLKGAGTIVAAPDGRAAINSTGNPGMATGGMGDVLAGLIGALLAQHLEPWQAAASGVFLHGLAADRLATTRSIGYLASEVADELPFARHSLTDDQKQQTQV